MKSKLTTIIIAAVAVFTVAGAGAVLAATNHSLPSLMPRASNGTSTQQANEFEAQGVIQQVTFDQGSAHSGNLVFLPNGQQTTVKVIFTAATEIKVGGGNGGDSSHDQNDDNGNDNAQPGVLQAGMTVKVEGVTQADGSVLAREIEANANDANDNDDNDNNDQEDRHLFGVIQSVDQGAQTFVFLQDGQTTPVTIAFDSKTNIEDEHDDGHDNAILAAGAHVRVEVVTRSDGSLYAREIKPASDNEGDGGHNGDNGGGDNSGPGGSGDGGGDNSGSGSGHDGGGDNSGSGSGDSGH
jgi:hypothetical protein